ncbi:MAG: L-cysteate sulfo-lyase [Verrucomicrobiota bacterium]|jgi:L-cysteate sulfo-lyase
MDLSCFARYRLFDGPTAIEPLTSLNAELDGVRIFVKRDDVSGIGAGGNKLRKLEFLLGEAIAQGADTMLTVGGRQSNHARLTAAASARAGLKCELVLPRVVPRETQDYLGNGNIVLDGLFGAAVHDLPGDADVAGFVAARLEALARQGRKAYFAPVGGSSAVGCLGYADCAAEILRQSDEMGVRFANVLVPNGSSGTHAGLAAGFVASGKPASFVKSYAVYHPAEETHGITLEKARETLALLAPGRKLLGGDIVVNGDHRGEGYGIPTQGMIDAVRRVARAEGVLLDPVYSGKAFAGLLHDIEANVYKPGDNVLFVMTGGTPALFAYRETFEN